MEIEMLKGANYHIANTDEGPQAFSDSKEDALIIINNIIVANGGTTISLDDLKPEDCIGASGYNHIERIAICKLFNNL